MIKKIIFLFFVVLAIIYFRGINNHMKTNNSNSKIRIVSLSPSVTKKIIELDKTEYLVGRTFFCNYNEVKNVDVVSDLTHFNIDKIILLHPTHVISEYPIDEKSLYILKKNNINVISLNTPKSIKDIIANTEIIARITNSENRLKQLDHLENVVLKQTALQMREVKKSGYQENILEYFLDDLKCNK